VGKFAEAQRWSQTGRTDVRGLARALPNLASALRTGRADPDEVAEQLATANLMESFGDGHFKFALKANPNEKVSAPDFLLVTLSSMACPNNQEPSYQFNQDLEMAGRQGMEAVHYFLRDPKIPWKRCM